MNHSAEELHAIAWNPNANPDDRATASQLLRSRNPPMLEPIPAAPRSVTPDENYVEYRRWKLFWGLFVDSQEEINSLLREQNALGFKTVTFHHHNGVLPNLSLFRMVLVLAVQLLTLGFVSYYVGPSFVFARTSGAQPRQAVEEGSPWPCPK